MNSIEHNEQAALFRWAEMMKRKHPADTIISALSDLQAQLAAKDAECEELRRTNETLRDTLEDAEEERKAGWHLAGDAARGLRVECDGDLGHEAEQILASRDGYKARCEGLENKITSDMRWETGFRNIVARTLGPRAPFDIPQIVDMVERVWWLAEVAHFRETCGFGGPWADAASDELDAIWEAALAGTEVKP